MQRSAKCFHEEMMIRQIFTFIEYIQIIGLWTKRISSEFSVQLTKKDDLGGEINSLDKRFESYFWLDI